MSKLRLIDITILEDHLEHIERLILNESNRKIKNILYSRLGELTTIYGNISDPTITKEFISDVYDEGIKAEKHYDPACMRELKENYINNLIL